MKTGSTGTAGATGPAYLFELTGLTEPNIGDPA